MNAQLGSHDVDVAVYHKPTNIIISVECKLAAKGSYRYKKRDDLHTIRVKCMRSRTLGETRVEQQATKLDIDPQLLTVHNDSYIPSDFDIVFTSIGNVFYTTREDGTFEWNPSAKEKNFLERFINSNTKVALQHTIFNTMFIAPSKGLACMADNDNTCLRRKCHSPNDCGFIPNYPFMIFDGSNSEPNTPWHSITHAPQVLREIAHSKAMNH
jgi:hypothetical protein